MCRTIYTEVCGASGTPRPASRFLEHVRRTHVESGKGQLQLAQAYIRKYGLFHTTPAGSVPAVQLKDALEAEQARFIHRSVPTAALGGLIVVFLVVIVFRAVVPQHFLYAWLVVFLVFTLLRLLDWYRFRRVEFDASTGRRWLRQASLGAFVSGVLWGGGALFLYPEGQLVFQYTFAVALIFMAVAALFSYGPHYRTFLAFYLPSIIPGIIGMGLQGGTPQNAFTIGLVLISVVLLWSRELYNRIFMESIQLRFANVELIEQLTIQKDAAEKAREAAEAANIAKSRFLAAASHDLRQPIHAMNLYLGAFAQVSVPHPVGQLVGKVRQCALIMDNMFRTLLDVSKLDAGAVNPQITIFALAPLFSRMRLEFEPQARAKGLQLRMHRCSAFAKSDPALVERILRNLISNAIRYTDQGRVVVGCRRGHLAMTVCVYDTGIGIAPHEQSLVFEAFYQVGNRARDRSKGLGLGLAIVERLARLLQMPLTLRSRPGYGSLFAFDLQRAEPVELPAFRLSGPVASRRDLSGTLIVVVDDEELVLDAVRMLLKQWNCEVIAAPSGRQAMRELATSTRPPDVLICDYRLRDDENGVAVVTALRNEFNADIPALLITGDTNPEQIRTIAASGLEVLHKPLREEELHDAICALLAQTVS
jgi:signal transduction histidine kinase